MSAPKPLTFITKIKQQPPTQELHMAPSMANSDEERRALILAWDQHRANNPHWSDFSELREDEEQLLERQVDKLFDSFITAMKGNN